MRDNKLLKDSSIGKIFEDEEGNISPEIMKELDRINEEIEKIDFSEMGYTERQAWARAYAKDNQFELRIDDKEKISFSSEMEKWTEKRSKMKKD